MGVLDIHFGYLGNFCHPPDDIADLLAEKFGQVFPGVLRVLDHVVQQAGGNGYFVQLHVGQDPGHGQRVGDIWLVGGPFLVQMGVGGNHVGFFQQFDVGFRVIAYYFFPQFVKAFDHFYILYINLRRYQLPEKMLLTGPAKPCILIS